jgi:hypothetical protein
LRWLVADANLETGRAPVNKLNSAFRLECGNGVVHVVGDDIAAVEQAGGHIFAIARITLDHLVVRLEAGHGDLLHRVGLMLSLGCGDDWRIRNEREVNTWVRDEVGLELGEIDVE